MASDSKQCITCGVAKNVIEFSRGRNECNACRAKKNKQRAETFDGFFQDRHTKLLSRCKKFKYEGTPITLEELKQLYRDQKGMCDNGYAYVCDDEGNRFGGFPRQN